MFDGDSEEGSNLGNITTFATLLFTEVGVTFIVVYFDVDGSSGSFLVLLYPADLQGLKGFNIDWKLNRCVKMNLKNYYF